MEYRPLHRLSLEEYERVEQKYRQIRKCVHCSQFFLEAENIGQWRCRLHPGVCRHSLDRNGEFYTCCQGTSYSQGCAVADHCGEELSVTDEAERHDELFEMLFAVVPYGLFQYGLKPPSPETTLYDSQQEAPRKRRRLCATASFNQTMSEEFDLRELAHVVSDSVRDSPVLLRTLPDTMRTGGLSRSEAIEKLEAAWPSHFDSGGIVVEQQRLMHEPDYTLPYLIVKRIH